MFSYFFYSVRDLTGTRDLRDENPKGFRDAWPDWGLMGLAMLTAELSALCAYVCAAFKLAMAGLSSPRVPPHVVNEDVLCRCVFLFPPGYGDRRTPRRQSLLVQDVLLSSCFARWLCG